MNIGDRIRWFRNRIGLTQKQLGMRVGFPDSNADIRIAQYEVGTRKPKADLTAAFAKALGVSPLALSIPYINNPLALIHMLFALEDCYGMWIEQGNGTFQICADPYNNQQAAQLYEMLGERGKRFMVDMVHPGLVDLFITQVRREYNRTVGRQSVKAALKDNCAQTAAKPNSHKKKEQSL